MIKVENPLGRIELSQNYFADLVRTANEWEFVSVGKGLNGSVEKVTDHIFIFAPEHVNINPEKIKQRSGFPPTV